jgi:hypothetical protein
MLASHLFRSTHTGPNTLGHYPLTAAFLRSFTGQKRGPQALSRARNGGKKIPTVYIPKTERRLIEKTLRDRFAPMLRQALNYWARMEIIRNEEIAAKAASDVAHPFIASCTKCQENERKRLEKAAARAKDIERARAQERKWGAATRANKKRKEMEESCGETQEEK